MEEPIKYAEELIERGAEQSRRPEIEQQVREMKSRLGTGARAEEQLREREAVLTTEQQVEQSKLNELQSQLDSMLDELERP
jgi:S-adenosylmethionine synthetase